MSLQGYVNSGSASLSSYPSLSRVFLLMLVLEKILVITTDGRSLIGDLLSCDQLTNLVLSQTVERIIRPQEDEEPSTEITHGLYLIRGEHVAVCGLVDEERDASIDWSLVKGAVIGGVKHV